MHRSSTSGSPIGKRTRSTIRTRSSEGYGPDLPIDIRPRTRFPCAGDPRTAADQRADREHVVSSVRDHQGKSVIWVPLVVGGAATGVISLQNIDREHAFSEADVRLLTTLAGSLSVALENARLFERQKQRNAGTRTHHRRPAGTSSEPRHAVDV